MSSMVQLTPACAIERWKWRYNGQELSTGKNVRQEHTDTGTEERMDIGGTALLWMSMQQMSHKAQQRQPCPSPGPLHCQPPWPGTLLCCQLPIHVLLSPRHHFLRNTYSEIPFHRTLPDSNYSTQ